MSAAPTSQPFVTLEEYFELENRSEQKHDYDNGQIVAMSGASDSHIRISANIVGETRNALKKKSCEAVGSDFRIGFPGRTFTHYPDAAIVCDGMERDPRDKTGQTFLNPKVIFEIQSPSTALFDRSTKFDRYRTLASFREYVVVFQDRQEIQTFFKQEDGTWILESFFTGDLPLKSLGVSLPIAEIFDRVTFPPEPAEDAPAPQQPGQGEHPQ